jgi:YVTN family beta-propeller protein
MVAVSESLDRIFTSNVSSGTISIIEENAVTAGSGQRKTWRVTNIAAGHGTEGFDVSPDGKEIWAASAQDATVTIIDVTSKRVTQTLPISMRGANRLKFTPDGTRVLISGLGGGAGSNLVVLEAATRKEVKKFDLGGGAAGIVMVPDGSRAYVAVSGKDKVAVVDLKSMEVSGSVSTGKQPDGLAWVQGKK